MKDIKFLYTTVVPRYLYPTRMSTSEGNFYLSWILATSRLYKSQSSRLLKFLSKFLHIIPDEQKI